MSLPEKPRVESVRAQTVGLLLVLMGVLHVPQLVAARAPAHSRPLVADQAQSAPSRAGQARSQKVSNPLNDLLDEAQRDIDKSDFEAAIAPLQKFLAEKPDVAYGHFQLAYVYTALKRPDDARSEYERTIALDPKMPEAYLNLGMLLMDRQEYAAAVAPLRKAVDLLPAQSRPRYLLGVAQDRSGDQAGAVESFEAVSNLDPNDLTAINYLAQAALRNNKPA